ncbi:putative 4-phosphopantetheinyl transferase EntD [Escherichia coli P0298942.6]|nr:putative 4-phosphopantetheinyl transferase EntD [Escherichia coli 2875150]ENB44634.1 putative 4-phosphopantetheinyl transferase EntD [Escherichia coli P0298942.11]ENB53643.1 putative 4-phosphopantetheinyl transferase EntD [Escherichia coli P0298942.12]ENB56989.1 putative 4-phosphopantetheinyl transferase EntD [Escherichia coli P0298942.15]ENB57187.1 putative 4-phosphopantetheinyl transferase EntD [Escherichia coli P0298942.6]ENB71837.1 putative 4-phosphopantetheinyl transferase EntD [Escher
MRFVHAGCGANALPGLQKFANSIDYRIHVDLISEAHQAFLLLSSVSG